MRLVLQVPFLQITDTPAHMSAPIVYAFKFLGLEWVSRVMRLGCLKESSEL